MRYPSDGVDAVILAGGINRIKLFSGDAPGYKALLTYNGKPSVQYTLEALREVPEIRRICLVGPRAELVAIFEETAGLDILPSGETLMESILIGLRHFSSSPLVLFTTADLPLITPGAVRSFIKSCAAIETGYGSNLFWAVVPERCFTGAYSKVRKGFNRFRDIDVCHGNLMMTDPRLMDNPRVAALIDAAYNARKNSVRAAMAIGWRVGLSYLVGVHLLRRLTLERMARIVSRRFDLGVIPVLLEHPEITVDVDEPEDYRFIDEKLKGKEDGA